MSQIEALVKALPKLTTTASSESASATGTETVSSTTQYSATVTPPSADGNPNVWHSNSMPDGTVFIAVGSVVGAILLGMMLWAVITGHLSRRTAKKTLNEAQYSRFTQFGSEVFNNGDDKEFSAAFYTPEYGEIKEMNKKYRRSGSKVRDSNSSETDIEAEWSEPAAQEAFNAIQDPYTRYNRNSLFISPTIEVVQKSSQLQGQRNLGPDRPYHQSSLSATSLLSSMDNPDLSIGALNRPERAASPERKDKKVVAGYHTRNKSSLGLTPVSSNTASGDNRANERRPRGSHKKTPSMFLEDMLNVDNAA